MEDIGIAITMANLFIITYVIWFAVTFKSKG